MFSEMQNPALSRTAQYKKITKPLLERKRRARINRCLDELKELMMGALEAEGENISKLEKADILELTVRHLQRIHRNGGTETDRNQEAHRFQAGFGQCAAEACQFLLLLEPRLGRSLIRHLSSVPIPPPRSLCYSPPLSPVVKLSEATNQSINCNPITVTDNVVVVNPDSNEAQQCDVSRVIYNNGNRVTVDSGTKKALRTVILERNRKIKKSESISIQNINKKQENNNNNSAASEGEEEIDIENVEELENMWRPW